uniref:Syntaxin binding protein 3 n=1 Tax=Gopherus agassizii TaxID=38772 RepID=A0A452H9L0_9SAUR
MCFFLYVFKLMCVWFFFLTELKLSVFDDCRKEEEWKIIILDDFTTKLLSSCGKMTDLLAEGITAVENVYKNREPVPHMKAIYFITPTKKSIDGLINDFVSKSSSKYKAAYVYFTDFCPDSLFNKMKSSCSRAIRRCKEINISFFPYESQVFTLDVPDAFFCCYSPTVEKANGKDAIMEAMAEQIVTLCATLEENPGVRYKRICMHPVPQVLHECFTSNLATELLLLNLSLGECLLFLGSLHGFGKQQEPEERGNS